MSADAFCCVDAHLNLPLTLQRLQLSTLDEYCELVRGEREQAVLLVSVASDATQFQQNRAICEQSATAFGVIGIHPLYANQWSSDVQAELAAEWSKPSTIAAGEIGLDFHEFGEQYAHYASREEQLIACRAQLVMAVERGLPIVVHCREADEEMIEILKELVPQAHRLNVHCFTSSLAFAEQLLQHFDNCFIGFSGVICFKNCSQELQQVVSLVPLNRILIETDAPFLCPKRGQTNDSRFIEQIARQVARLKAVETSAVLQHATDNLIECFQLKERL